MTTQRTLALAAVAMQLAIPGIVAAQTSVALDRFAAGETVEDDFAMSRPTDFGHLRFGAQLHLDYGLNPLVYEANLGEPSSERFSIVEHQLNANLGVSFGLFDRLVIFGGLPVALVLDGSDQAAAAGLVAANGAGLGDAYLGARGRIWGEEGDLFILGAQATLTLPTAGVPNSPGYRGEDFITFHPEVLAEIHPGLDSRIVVNVGARFREEDAPQLNLELRHELTFGVGFGIPVWWDESDRRTHLDAHAQIYGSTPFAHGFTREHTALEATVGAKLFHASGFVGGLALGPGLARGMGSPDFRLVAMVGWAMPEAGGDDDRCPNEPEDRDGFEDHDGCPDPDNDQDGILDDDDRCPNEAETVNGVSDEDGCPDTVGDSDGDGLLDPDDQCPNEAEDRDGFQDEDGCPDLDNDGDGVEDADDECPLEAGSEAARGCPDRDNDSVVDSRDNCPDEPGPPANQGCAEEQAVVISERGLQILDKVYFRTNSAVIETRSHALLQNVARVLNNHPEITRIQVEGHTDSRGDRDRNLSLSQRRADAVVEFLVTRGGVDRGRLSARGFGPDRPVVEGATTDEQHGQNRRVEFNIPDDAS